MCILNENKLIYVIYSLFEISGILLKNIIQNYIILYIFIHVKLSSIK